MINIYQAVLEALQAGEAVCLATIVEVRGSTPRGPGAKMLVRADGTILGTIGGGAMEAQVIRDAQDAIRTSASGIRSYGLHGHDAASLGICGGEADIFMEVISPQRELVIVGGGHIALFLAQFSSLLGFRTVVIDDRPEFANKERFPTADLTLVAAPGDMAQALPISENSCVVIATRGHEYDAQALAAALATPARYVGMIGSRRKVRSVLSELQEQGFSPEDLGRIYTPIGLEIGTETPAEIALSIMAEILMALRGGSGRPLRESGNPFAMKERQDG